MTDKKQERADRNHERSEEAHWQVAETGVEDEEEERLSKGARQAEEQDDWENEGGAPRSRPEEETTEQGD
jgi:hypothetical protein